MSALDSRGWRDKWDELEHKADPEIMPLVLMLRADFEFIVELCKTQREAIDEALEGLKDLRAVHTEHNV